jgi:hypothetical protein
MLFHDMLVVSPIHIGCWHLRAIVFLEIIPKGKFGSGRFIELGFGLIVKCADATIFIGAEVFNF